MSQIKINLSDKVLNEILVGLILSIISDREIAQTFQSLRVRDIWSKSIMDDLDETALKSLNLLKDKPMIYFLKLIELRKEKIIGDLVDFLKLKIIIIIINQVIKKKKFNV